MKRTLYIILLLASGIYAQAQTYVQLYGGVGPSNVRVRDMHDGFQSKNASTSKNALGYHIQLGIGRQWGNLFVTTGIGYMHTGRNVTYNYWANAIESPGTHNMRQARRSEDYSHVTIPLNIGYGIRLYEKLSLIPSIGILGSYNTSVRFRQTDRVNMANVYHIALFDLDYTYKGSTMRPFRPYSLWGSAQADVSYCLTSRISALVGISYYRMLTSIIDPKGYPQHLFPKSMYNSLLSFNAGIRVSLASNSASRKYPLSSCGRW